MVRFNHQQGTHEGISQDISWLSWKEPVVCGLGSHIGSHNEILNIELFFLLFEKLEEDIFVILPFFIDLLTIFELITILSVNYGDQWLLLEAFE